MALVNRWSSAMCGTTCGGRSAEARTNGESHIADTRMTSLNKYCDSERQRGSSHAAASTLKSILRL